MLISKTFRYKLKLNKSQTKTFERWAGSCRFLYNLALEQRIWAWENQKRSLNYFSQANELPTLKIEAPFLSECPSQALQQTLKDLEQAYKNFFNRIKTGDTPGFPRFKKKGQNDAFRFPQINPKNVIQSKDSKYAVVKLPKVGKVKFISSRLMEGRIRNLTIRRVCNHWYVSFNCEIEKDIKENINVGIGIDRGIATTIQCSNGKSFDLPSSIKRLEKRKRILQKRLSRKRKFSSNWNKQTQKISKLSNKIAAIRQDRLHFVSSKIAKNHGTIFLEKLKVKNMTRSAKGSIDNPGKNVKAKAGLNREILNQGWSMFEAMLTYKALWNGGSVQYVDPKHTSQRCSKCGHIAKENRLSQSKFECMMCSYKENADLNAAINIYTLGLKGCASGATSISLS